MPTWTDAFSGYSNYTLSWLWSTVRQEVANNRSLIRRRLAITRDGGSGTYNGGTSTWSTTGGPARSGSFTYDFRNYTTLVLLDEEVWIRHAADGTLSVNTSATATAAGALGSATVTTKTVTSPTIPRATTPVLKVGSTTTSTLDAGQTLTIELPRASTAFTHEVSWKFGTQGATLATAATTSTSWATTLPLLAEIPNSTSGAGEITVITKNGTTPVGTVKKAFTLNAPASVVPTISALELADANPTTVAKVGAYVQGQSLLRGTITAAGAHGSTIASTSVSVDGGTSPSGGSIPLPLSGTRAVAGAVVDSRGRTATQAGSISVLPYALPRINSHMAQRATNTGVPSATGAYLLVSLDAAISSLVVSSVQKNKMAIAIHTRPRGGTTWTARNVIPAALAYSNNILVDGGGIYSASSAWDVRITVSDELQSSQVIYAVAVAGAILDATPTKIGLGKLVEDAGPVLQLQGPARLYEGGLTVDGAITQNGQTVVDASQVATVDAKGVIELATQAEVSTGTDSTRAVTPNALRNAAFMAYASAAGEYSSTASIGTGTGRTTTITFPSGRFSKPPLVFITNSGSARLTTATLTVTATSVQVRQDNFSGANASGETGFQWFAIQMTSASAAG